MLLVSYWFLDCGMLDMPSNGNMVMTGTKYGDTARFTCNTAYSLQGAALLTCLETGWDNQQPNCRHIGNAIKMVKLKL